jgi:hypothetical protein
MQRQYITKNSNNNSSTNTQKSTLTRTAITQIGTNTPITQQEIENQQYQQDQFEATKLQIQAKYGTITPEGQERLNLLQAKKAEFWQRYLAPVRHFKNFADIPITREQAEAKSKKAIQAKLTIGAPGDKYEQEADRVAAQVVNQINAPVSVQPTQNLQREEMSTEDELMKKPEISGIQREAMPEVEEELQMKQAGDGSMAAPAELESSIQQARSGGQPLADNIRKPMEHAFGADFSRVKIHADSQADQLNQSIQAKAFTTGHDVFFRQGEYNPGSRGGQELLAHELTHVVQQNRKTNEIQRGGDVEIEDRPSWKADAKKIKVTGDEDRRHVLGWDDFIKPNLEQGINEMLKNGSTEDDVKKFIIENPPNDLKINKTNNLQAIANQVAKHLNSTPNNLNPDSAVENQAIETVRGQLKRTIEKVDQFANDAFEAEKSEEKEEYFKKAKICVLEAIKPSDGDTERKKFANEVREKLSIPIKAVEQNNWEELKGEIYNAMFTVGLDMSKKEGENKQQTEFALDLYNKCKNSYGEERLKNLFTLRNIPKAP